MPSNLVLAITSLKINELWSVGLSIYEHSLLLPAGDGSRGRPPQLTLTQARSLTMPSSPPALPTNRAFVVQFRPPAPDGSPTYDGRVEHLVSGQEARFHSLEELLAFMVRVLTDVQRPSGAD
jgi:hypothetical protein